MASDTIALGIADADARPIGERLHDWVVTVDHKKLGILYITYSLVMLVIGGIEATIMRIQLIVPHNDFVSPQVFNMMFTLHGTTMIFVVAMPILFGFGTYLIPLMIGTRDMAFPRLNALSFWLTAFGGLLLYFSFIGGNGLYCAEFVHALLRDDPRENAAAGVDEFNHGGNGNPSRVAAHRSSDDARYRS